MNLNSLHRRIIDISHKNGLSHLSSCLTAVDIINNVYLTKLPSEPFVLSNGHAGLALYTVLEKFERKDAEELYARHGVHPNRNLDDGIYCSSGSLGSAITIAVGMAIAKPERNIYVMLSDGECAEGSVWEALRVAGELRLENLRVIVNANGTSALDKVDVDLLEARLQMFFPSVVVRTQLFDYPDYLQGVDGHYKVLNDDEYKEITENE